MIVNLKGGHQNENVVSLSSWIFRGTCKAAALLEDPFLCVLSLPSSSSSFASEMILHVIDMQEEYHYSRDGKLDTHLNFPHSVANDTRISFSSDYLLFC